ncbi:hypothetical protein GF312_19370 [Candidatus Poribacteria bacterium]|nr:hypothetical protein [Candidatus Poribacteria bacterium]
MSYGYTIAEDLDVNEWHEMKIEKIGKSYKFYVDGILKENLKNPNDLSILPKKLFWTGGRAWNYYQDGETAELWFDDIKAEILTYNKDNLKTKVPTSLKTNFLGRNFPNPANPETWIPYKIKKNSNIIIFIHNSAGQLVKSLDIGYQEAGEYMIKEKAAHWDGTNEYGEKVACGIYFYTLHVDNFVSTRRLFINQ